MNTNYNPNAPPLVFQQNGMPPPSSVPTAIPAYSYPVDHHQISYQQYPNSLHHHNDYHHPPPTQHHGFSHHIEPSHSYGHHEMPHHYGYYQNNNHHGSAMHGTTHGSYGHDGYGFGHSGGHGDGFGSHDCSCHSIISLVMCFFFIFLVIRVVQNVL